jgi:DNA-binding IclR family transcriptional regulator
VKITSDNGTVYSIAAVSSAIDLLRAFEQAPHEFTASELARLLGTNRNQVYRLLRTLESKGFIYRTGTLYRIGMRAYWVGAIAVRYHDDLVRTARPYLADLNRLTGETAVLMTVSDEQAVCLERVESREIMRIVIDVGLHLPLHAGGAQKVLMAHLTEARREALIASGLPPLSPQTIVDPDQLRAELETIRRSGYALSDDEAGFGGASVGAAVRDFSGEVVAALAVAGPAGRVRRRLPMFRDLVLEGASGLSQRLGWVASAAHHLIPDSKETH